MTHNADLLQKLAQCVQACEMCLDACLGEKDINMLVQCIRLDRDCAKICELTSSFVASNSPFTMQLLNLCEEICRRNAEECSKHDMEHCRKCANSCLECAESCKITSREKSYSS